jgi:hypothetical protein
MALQSFHFCLAGRTGPEGRSFTRHHQSTGLLMSEFSPHGAPLPLGRPGGEQ